MIDCYDVKLDDGRIWKHHISQIKEIGNQISNEKESCNIDSNGPIENDKLITENRSNKLDGIFRLWLRILLRTK